MSKVETVKTGKKVTVKTIKKANNNSLKVKVHANNTWKLETFSLSALVRFAKSPKGITVLKPICDLQNAKYGTTLTPNIISVANIVKHASKKELTMKDGTKKVKFSFWLVILTIGRIAKSKKA